jgi:hypothetical protein
MSQDSSFNLAIKYIHQKQYQKAESILQNLIRTLPFDETIVLYYGYALIEQQKYEDALTVYRQYLSINSDQYRLLRAYCYAKMGFLEKSLNDWIKLSKEGNKIAASLLNDLKKSKDNKAFLTFLKYNKACGQLPPANIEKKIKKQIKNESFQYSAFDNKKNTFNFNFFKKNKIAIFLSIFVIVVFAVLLLLNNENLKIKQDLNKNQKITINQDSQSNEKLILPIAIIYQYKENKQVEKDIALAKRYITQSDYNNARLLLNKIIYSNADEKYKEKSKNLEHLLTEPFFNKLIYNPSFNEVIQNPLLYSNIFVQWKAIVYELIDDLNFSVMIYSKNPIYIDGIANCILPKPYPLFVKQQVEIFGKILSVVDSKIPKIEIKNIRVIYE